MTAPAETLTEQAGGPPWRSFFRELRRLGYAEGENLVIERYSAEGRPERYTDLAHEVLSRDPEVIVPATGTLAAAFVALTDQVPIVTLMTDPVRRGLVASLARPGGNLTGAAPDAGIEIVGKRLQIIKEAVVNASRLAYLTMQSSWDGTDGQEVRAAAERLGVGLSGLILHSSTPEEYRRAFERVAEQPPDALLVSVWGDLWAHRQLIVELAAKARLPAIYPFPDYARLGGLMAYSVDLADMFRQLAYAVDQILKGTKPGDIPIYQAVKFEFLINLKTAETLGLAIPQALLARADEVIE